VAGANYLRFAAGNAEVMRIDLTGVCNWYDGVGGTRMTLNATGLGVGGSPITKFFVQDATLTGASQIREQVIRAASDNTNNSFNSLVGFTFSAAAAAYSAGSLVRSSGVYGINLDNAAFGRRMGLVFYTSEQDATALERMRIDNSGNVGIGVTPSAWQSSVKAVQLGGAALSSFSTYVGFLTSNAYNDGVWKFVSAQGASRYEINANVHSWHVSTNSPSIGGAITFTQAMTLDASGNLLVGTTSALASGSTIQNLGTSRQVLTLKGDAFGSYTAGVWNASTTNDGLFVYFGTEATLTVRGGISYNRGGGLVAYNTTSDYRAKDIIGPVSNSGSLIDSLKVYVGKMKGATIERPMLIAHEAQEVAPYAVTGTKDEVDTDGNPKYQQMDVSALVPVLIAEIQSLRARVQTLEAK
jgi:hypothetical protein